jgi:hypothetical protein
MIPSLKEIYAFVPYEVNDTMFFGKTSRPRARHQILKRFGFPDATEWIAHYRLNKIKRP